MCGSKALSLSQLRNRDGEFFADGEEEEIISIEEQHKQSKHMMVVVQINPTTWQTV
jgi:hypothetical protein